MTREDKDLLSKDLCTRLPYGVLCYINDDDTNTPRKLRRIEVDELDGTLLDFWTGREDCPSMQVYLSEVKPYLRPMSSMTKEEEDKFVSFTDTIFRFGENDRLCFFPLDAISWLNKKMFDYKGLIEKGLAIEVTEENNPYELD